MFKRRWKEKSLFNFFRSFVCYYKVDEEEEDDYEVRDIKLEFRNHELKGLEKTAYKQSSKSVNVYDYTGHKLLPLFRLEKMLEKRNRKFSETLLAFIDETGMKDSEAYKKAGIDRKHFSKIRTNPDYAPKKITVFSFAIALELSLEETERLLESAGYVLSNSYEFDIIIRFFIQRKIYDRYTINEILHEYHQETI